MLYADGRPELIGQGRKEQREFSFRCSQPSDQERSGLLLCRRSPTIMPRLLASLAAEERRKVGVDSVPKTPRPRGNDPCRVSRRNGQCSDRNLRMLVIKRRTRENISRKQGTVSPSTWTATVQL